MNNLDLPAPKPRPLQKEAETTKKIDLTVNGDIYREMNVLDKLSGMRKFHEGVDVLVKLFSDWGFYENRN